MPSFVENINKLAEKLEIIVESNEIFDDNTMPILEEIADLDLKEAIWDLRKGNYLGNRKIDINLALNRQGITEDLIEKYPDQAEDIWTDLSGVVLYDRCTVTFTDGDVITINFEFDGNPTTISTHGDLLIQFSSNDIFLAKLEDTLISGFAWDVVGEIVRIYDVIGQNSNIERIQLHAVSGDYIDQTPIYYWAKTTSAFQTLSMRAGDIIKLGNDIDSIILLASRISEMLELQSRIPELVDTYTGDVPNNDLTVYNALDELMAVYAELEALVTVYNDIKPVGTNYIQSVATDLQGVNNIGTVADDLNLGLDSNINIVGSNIDDVVTVSDNIGSVNINGANIDNININATSIANVNNVGNNIANVNTVSANISSVNTVSTNIANVNTVSGSIADVNSVIDNLSDIDLIVTNLSSVGTVSSNIDSINSVATNITPVLDAESNATIATEQAIIATNQASIATTQAGIATTKSNEIKNVSVGNTVTALPSMPASVVYSSSTGKFTFVIPKGDKGDRGEAFQVNSVGTILERGLYDDRTKGFSFLAIDEASIYFKMSDTVGDWSPPSPFGKGETGDTGATGTGIASIAFTSTTNPDSTASVGGYTDTYTITYTDTTTDTFTVYNGRGISSVTFTSTTSSTGLPSQSGADDTYTIIFTDNTTTTFVIHNGLDSAVVSVAGKTGDVVLSKADVGLGNVDNTTDLNKPISNATQIVLNAKQSVSTALNDSNYATKVFSDTTIAIDKTWSSDKINSSIGTVTEFEATLS